MHVTPPLEVAPEPGRGQFAQFVVNERQKLFSRLEIPLVDRRKDLCDVRHGL